MTNANQKIVDALRDVLSSFGAQGRDNAAAQKTAKRYAKDNAVKDAFAPITKLLKHYDRDVIVQTALELAPEHELHRAASALLQDTTVIAATPWTSIAPVDALPKRWVRRLIASNQAPIVYAVENVARVSMWSLEDGAFIGDLKVPGKAGTTIVDVVQLDDGTLRALASDGCVCERDPDDAAFTRVCEIGALPKGSSGVGWSPDLRYVVLQDAHEPERRPGGIEIQSIGVHDAVKDTTRTVYVPAAYLLAGPIVINTVAVLGFNRSVGETSESLLAFIDVTSGALETLTVPGDPRNLVIVDDAGVLGVDLIDENMNTTFHHLDVRTKRLTAAQEVRRDDAPIALQQRGVTFAPQAHAIVDRAGARVASYRIAGDPYKTIAIADEARDQFVVAGGDPAAPVVVIRPYARAIATKVKKVA